MEVNFASEIFNPKFFPLLENNSRHLVLYGGAASGKSIFAGQKLLWRMLTERNHRFVMVRKVHKTIRNSQYKMLTKELIESYNLSDLFELNKTEMTISCPSTNGEIIAVGIDSPEKIKSLSKISGIWYEEPTELTPEDFRQMSMRMRGRGQYYKQEILTFNPINENHWLVGDFFPPAIKQALKKNPNNIANLVRRIKAGEHTLSLRATINHRLNAMLTEHDTLLGSLEERRGVIQGRL